jgi:hypothetical protein
MHRLLVFRRFSSTAAIGGDIIGHLRRTYETAKRTVEGIMPMPPKVDPRAVFANHEVDLSKIEVIFVFLKVVIVCYYYRYMVSITIIR